MRKKTLKIKFFLLFCSLAGYSTIISAQDKTVKEKNEKDSTIISIPYGSKLKTEFSGASDVISGKVLENVPVQHLSNALSGRISGLTTIQRSGEPGNDEASIYIRGIRSNGNGAIWYHHKYSAVTDFSLFFISDGVPANSSLPPASPPSGPNSTT